MKNASNYKLSVIMTNYKQGEYIETAIQSVLKQRVNFEYKVIICDDCSGPDDKGIEISKKYKDSYSNIELIIGEENVGYLGNQLRGLREAKTEYFCLLDADDYYTDDLFLQRAIDFLDDHRNYVIYEANVLTDDGTSQKPFISKNVRSTNVYPKDYVSEKAIPITQTTGMVLRNVIFENGNIPQILETAIGGISEQSFHGDWDRFVMHIKYGNARYEPECVGVYRLTNSGLWTSKNSSGKYLLAARMHMDYYAFYDSDREFFVNRAWECYINYYKFLSLEAKKLCVKPQTEKERKLIESLQCFFGENKDCIYGRGTFFLKRIRRKILSLYLRI